MKKQETHESFELTVMWGTESQELSAICAMKIRASFIYTWRSQVACWDFGVPCIEQQTKLLCKKKKRKIMPQIKLANQLACHYSSHIWGSFRVDFWKLSKIKIIQKVMSEKHRQIVFFSLYLRCIFFSNQNDKNHNELYIFFVYWKALTFFVENRWLCFLIL